MVWLVVFAMVAMVFTACDDDGGDEIKDNEGGETALSGLKLLNNREIDRNGGTFYWAVKAAGEWTLDAASLPGWLQMAPLKGEKGTTGVVVEFAELAEDTERMAELPFKMGTEEIKIAVKQTADGKTASAVCEFLDTKMFGIEGGELLRRVSVSADWTVTTADSWLAVSPANGVAGETELTLNAEASNGVDVRVAVLRFDLGDTIMELAVIQGLNQSFPKLGVTEEAAVSGRQVTMKGDCEFINDELAISEVGFAYSEQGTEEWQELPCEADLTNANIAFETVVILEYGQSYDYKPYAKIGEEVFYGEVASFDIEGKPAPADGVWYYENFDGMYDPETGEYQKKITNYRYWDYKQFDEHGGFLRKNQPNCQYKLEMDDMINGNLCYISMRNSAVDGRLSAQIHAPDVEGLPGIAEGTQFYPGASGNWKIGSNWKANWNFIVTGLDFAGAGNLQLTFGCATDGGSLSTLPAGRMEVYVSTDDGATWEKKEYTVGAPVDIANNKWWKPVTVDHLSDEITAIRIVLNVNSTSVSMALDDIKVVAVP